MKTKASDISIVLIVLQIFLALGAIFGGGMLIIDPSGELLKMPLSLLEQSPFPNYFIPGVLLFFILGVIPIWISLGLIFKRASSVANKLNVFPQQHWAWSFTLYTGFALLIWIFAQAYFFQAVYAVHLVYFTLGIIIQIVTLLPGVQKKYRLS
ncbi:hypothetical protein J2Z32_000550 [Paenibacillus turicensis]|uniref:Uncharacterized protein n=1 Tax=Paenibacillus turicensis TaxID=160487 RepID=A0ABS4FMX3_9BACL|nr:hypothetical protein [Paenibacillus turicensis]MBP1903933.1 hypothetical protein [Paenibacillus turicensis]